MAFKVQVGPAQIALHQGQTVLLTETDGRVNWPSKCGLYFRDTRVISAWAIFANGELWDLLNGGAVAPQAARIATSRLKRTGFWLLFVMSMSSCSPPST